jgi:hypothetical protein
MSSSFFLQKEFLYFGREQVSGRDLSVQPEGAKRPKAAKSCRKNGQKNEFLAPQARAQRSGAKLCSGQLHLDGLCLKRLGFYDVHARLEFALHILALNSMKQLVKERNERIYDHK